MNFGAKVRTVSVRITVRVTETKDRRLRGWNAVKKSFRNVRRSTALIGRLIYIHMYVRRAMFITLSVCVHS